jgi:cell wall-associated NlpC family hydrolase
MDPAARGTAVRLLALALLAPAAVAGCGDDARPAKRPSDPVLTPQAASAARAAARRRGATASSHARVVQLLGAGAERPSGSDAADSGPSPGAQSDAEVRAELRAARAALRDFRGYLASTAYLPTGPHARVARDGTAVAPDDAPEVVKRVILAANQIAKFPYRWGGGHGAWRDSGYDCSGSVSFALAGAGLLDRPLTSGDFLRYGSPGTGKWITIFTNPGHIFMFVAGLRFDTSGRGRAGTRWQEAGRPTAGFAARHIPGL